MSDNDNDSHYHYDNDYQKDSSKNRAKLSQYAPTFIFFNFGMNCAIASSVPRKLFLYQLLHMRMISIINDLARMIVIIIIRMTCNHAIC